MHVLRLFLFASASLALPQLMPVAHAFSGPGHRTVGAIADIRLQGTTAQNHVRSIIARGDPDSGVHAIDCVKQPRLCTLEKYAVWADCAKGATYCPSELDGNPWFDDEMKAYGLKFTDFSNDVPNAYHHAFHYADIPIQEHAYRETSHGARKNDAVHVLADCIEFLRNPKGSANPRGLTEREALFLIAHIVGDLHQPLHVGAVYVASNGEFVNPNTVMQKFEETQGGNFLMLGNTNLHSYWDRTTVEHVMIKQIADPKSRKPALLAALLAKRSEHWQTKGEVRTWPAQWADEAIVLAREAYRVQLEAPVTVIDAHSEKSHLQWQIQDAGAYDQIRARDVVEKQLIKAGYRLAEVLKRIWP
jgi:hypothetical protein